MKRNSRRGEVWFSVISIKPKNFCHRQQISNTVLFWRKLTRSHRMKVKTSNILQRMRSLYGRRSFHWHQQKTHNKSLWRLKFSPIPTIKWWKLWFTFTPWSHSCTMRWTGRPEIRISKRSNFMVRLLQLLVSSFIRATRWGPMNRSRNSRSTEVHKFWNRISIRNTSKEIRRRSPDSRVPLRIKKLQLVSRWVKTVAHQTRFPCYSK